MKNKLQNSRFLLSTVDPLSLEHTHAEVAVIGRSNVGKSSVICGLCENKKLARVSKTPGRTQTINIYEMAHLKWLVDLPGYGFAQAGEKTRQSWPSMIGHYLGGRPSLACVYVLIDALVGPSPLDQDLKLWLEEKKIPYQLVATKVDKLSQSQQHHHRSEIAQMLKISPQDLLWVSAKEGYGMNQLRAHVLSKLSA